MPTTVHVQAGEFVATDRDLSLVTVLGSCVAACVRDRESGIGGMNHFMLPRSRDERGPACDSARYGVNAMELLINGLVTLGARRDRLEAKVFGGGNVLPGITMINVGGMNAAFVCGFLHDESIPVVARDLLGTVSRKVRFFPATGRAQVRLIACGHAVVLETEERYRESLRERPSGGAVEFF